MKVLFTILFSLIFLNAKAQGAYSSYSLDFNNDSLLIAYGLINIDIDTLNYSHNVWQIGHPHKTVFTAAHSNPNAIVTDTVNSCMPNDTSVFILKIPFPFSGQIDSVSFWYKLNIDTGDITMVEMSGAHDTAWKNILDTSIDYISFPIGKPDFSKSTLGWDSTIISTIKYDFVDTIFLRFTFISDSQTSKRDGWMLDDFIINVDTWPDKVPNLNKNINCNIYPNPAKDNLHLKYSLTTQANLSITLTNILGQTLKTKYIPHTLAGTADIPVSDLPNGLYFYSLQSDKQRITGKVVIEH